MSLAQQRSLCSSIAPPHQRHAFPGFGQAALINSAVDLDDAGGTGPTPNNDEGWGRVDLTQIIGSPRGVDFVDQSVLLTNHQVFEQSFSSQARLNH